MDSVLVVKCGGNSTVDTEAVCRDVAELVHAGRPVVLVHGGSSEIERLAARLGIPQRTLVAPDGLTARYTDEETLRVVTLALVGLVKPRLVGALARHGVSAIGLTGLDGGLLRARRKTVQRAIVDGRRMLVRDNLSGTVQQVAGDLLMLLLSRAMVPVISPPALADGEPVNVNADRAAAAVAAALPTRLLVFLTGAPGVLGDPTDESTALDTLVLPESGATVEGVAGGMALKLVAAREALAGGVDEVRVADGRGGTPVRDALAGAGTRVLLAESRAGHGSWPTLVAGPEWNERGGELA